MSGNSSETKTGKGGYFALLISISVLLLLLKSTLPVLLTLVGGTGAWQIWKRFQKLQQEQTAYLDAIFYRLIRENQGRITPLDLAMNTKLPAQEVQDYLDRRATEFAAHFDITEQGGILYYFETVQSFNTAAAIAPSESSVLEAEILPPSEEFNSQTEPEQQTPSPPQKQKKGDILLFPVPPTSSPETVESVPSGLNQIELAKRLQVHPSTLSKWKKKPQFREWSSQKDPNAIAWYFSQKAKRFYPIIPKTDSARLNQNLQ